jgi:hypothetical protein
MKPGTRVSSFGERFEDALRRGLLLQLDPPIGPMVRERWIRR